MRHFIIKFFFIFSFWIPGVITVSGCKNDQPTNIYFVSTFFEANKNTNFYDKIINDVILNHTNIKFINLLNTDQNETYLGDIFSNINQENPQILKKVFILKPNIVENINKNPKDSYLLNAMMQTSNMEFYLLNGNVTGPQAAINKIFNIKFNNMTWSEKIVESFLQKLRKLPVSQKAQFFEAKNTKFIVKLAAFLNINNEFEKALLLKIIETIKTLQDDEFEFEIVENTFFAHNYYDEKDLLKVEFAAKSLFFLNNINFVLNCNPWYNDVFTNVVWEVNKNMRNSNLKLRDIISYNDYESACFLTFAYDFEEIIKIIFTESKVETDYIIDKLKISF